MANSRIRLEFGHLLGLTALIVVLLGVATGVLALYAITTHLQSVAGGPTGASASRRASD